MHQFPRHGARWSYSRPAHDRRYADTSLVGRPLSKTEGVIIKHGIHTAIVRKKHNDGIVRKI